MKILYLVVFLLSLVLVTALSPAPEVECCYNLKSLPDNIITKECVAIENVSAESCITIIAQWEESVNEFDLENARIQEIIGPCCVEVMRDNELSEECANLEMDKESCEPIAADYMSRYKGIPLFSNTTLAVIGILILAGIIWFFRRKK